MNGEGGFRDRVAPQPEPSSFDAKVRQPGLRWLAEPLQVAMDNGAKRALIRIENKRSFLEVNPDIVEHVDPVFYWEPRIAALKVLGAL